MASYGAVQMRWTRLRPAGQPAEDVAVNTLHCQVTDGGWTTDDRDTFHTALATLFNDIKGYISANVKLDELRYYNVPAVSGPYGDPAFTETAVGLVGIAAATGELPPQCACSITLHTASRRHWGRIYLPGLATGTISYGRFSTTFVDGLAGSFDTFATTLRSGAQGIVIWDRTNWTPRDVQTGRVDDVVDVIRRRRFDHSYHVADMSFV